MSQRAQRWWPRYQALLRRLDDANVNSTELALRLSIETPRRRRHFFRGGTLVYTKKFDFVFMTWTVTSTFRLDDDEQTNLEAA